jgi:hypothetical protein
MSAVIILLALSALIGFALGTSFSWLAIAASGLVLAHFLPRHCRSQASALCQELRSSLLV